MGGLDGSVLDDPDREAMRAQRRRPLLSWWVLVLVALTLALVVVALLFPRFARVNPHPSPHSVCMAHLKQIAMASLVYAQDYDGQFVRLPGWDDALLPYVERPDWFHCPSDRGNNALSYAMNPDVGGLSVPTQKTEGQDWVDLLLPDDAATTVAFFDGEGPEVIERHHEGANYAFLDSHVKWLADPPEGSGLIVREDE